MVYMSSSIFVRHEGNCKVAPPRGIEFRTEELLTTEDTEGHRGEIF
jgi:hypothetical protein